MTYRRTQGILFCCNLPSCSPNIFPYAASLEVKTYFVINHCESARRASNSCSDHASHVRSQCRLSLSSLSLKRDNTNFGCGGRAEREMKQSDHSTYHRRYRRNYMCITTHGRRLLSTAVCITTARVYPLLLQKVMRFETICPKL